MTVWRFHPKANKYHNYFTDIRWRNARTAKKSTTKSFKQVSDMNRHCDWCLHQHVASDKCRWTRRKDKERPLKVPRPSNSLPSITDRQLAMKVFCIPISKQFDAKLNGKAHGKVYALRLEGDKQTRDSEVWGVVSRIKVSQITQRGKFGLPASELGLAGWL